MPTPDSAFDSIIASVMGAQVGGQAEAAFAQVIAGAVAPSAASPEFPFPKSAAIRKDLTDDPKNWPLVIERHLRDFALLQFTDIPPTPVAGVAGAAKVAWNTVAQLALIARHESAVAFTPPATNGLGKPLTRFDYKLHQLQENPGGDIAHGVALLKAYVESAPPSVPASAYTSLPVAVHSINCLAAVECFCIRIASAVIAAARAGVSLAETLALWREEGDLLTPYSEQRRFYSEQRRPAGAPAGDFVDDISLGDVKEEVLFSMKRGLWTFTYNKLATRLPADAAEKLTHENAFKLAAFKHWSLITAGTDYFWKTIVLDLGNRTASVERIAKFLEPHRAAHAQASVDPKAIEAECEAILNDFVCTLPTALTARVIVAPRKPLPLLSLILFDALVFFSLDTVVGHGPVVAPTPRLKYLAYHCQDHRDAADPAQDKFTLLLVSAACAAVRGPAGALRTSLIPFIADLPRTSDLPKPDFKLATVRGDMSKQVNAYQKLKAGGWWTTANLDLLADFILTATPVQWVGWEELRGNMARYVKLRAYYEKLLS